MVINLYHFVILSLWTIGMCSFAAERGPRSTRP